MKKLVLASASPRRKEILENNNFEFTITVSDATEDCVSDNPVDLAIHNALVKAKGVSKRLADKNVVVLGADTIVVYDGEILGKPKDYDDAFRMLKNLSSNTHLVVTGWAVITDGEERSSHTTTQVEFNNLTNAQIKEYIETYKPFDKAGSYGIQDGFPLVKNYSGSYWNIVGLPIEDITPILNQRLGKD